MCSVSKPASACADIDLRSLRSTRCRRFQPVHVSHGGALPAALLALAPCALKAQQRTYADYPQKRGTEQLRLKNMPSWLTINGEFRGRTEGQTSYSYAQNGDRIYELTRAYIGMEVRPTRYLTGYLQAMDTHSLGLPLHATAANMRDVFDDRQAFLRPAPYA